MSKGTRLSNRMRTFANRLRTGGSSQSNFDLLALRTLACELLSRIEGSQLEDNFTKQIDKGGTRLSKGDRFHWLDKQSKFLRISRSSQIAGVLRIAIEVEKAESPQGGKMSRQKNFQQFLIGQSNHCRGKCRAANRTFYFSRLDIFRL